MQRWPPGPRQVRSSREEGEPGVPTGGLRVDVNSFLGPPLGLVVLWIRALALPVGRGALETRRQMPAGGRETFTNCVELRSSFKPN